jgi:hypothetical protein
MVRLVFRPYTQVRRTICTSVSLRASTRVSSGFTPLRHSSPSFGSRQACSNSNPSQKIRVGQRCVPLGTPTHQLPCASQVSEPVYSHACQTPWSVFQDGSDGEPAGCCSAVSKRTRLAARNNQLHQRWLPGAPMSPVLWPSVQPTTVRTTSRAADQHKPFRIRPGHIAGPHPLPSRQFQALFDSLFKVLFIFPSRYLFTIGLSPIFSLGRSLPPNLGCIPKQPDSLTAPRGETGSRPDGALTLPGDPFQGTWARSVSEDASPDYNSDRVQPTRFSSWAIPGSLAVTRGILVSFSSSAYLYA